jgi:hypothetical protein
MTARASRVLLAFVGAGAIAVAVHPRSVFGYVQRADVSALDFPQPADRSLHRLPDIQGQCIEFTGVTRGNNPDDYRDCAVTESGQVGTVDGTTYWYAIYCLIPSYNDDGARCGDRSFHATYFRNRGMALFAAEAPSGMARVLLDRVSDDYGLYYYERPQIVLAPVGRVLHIPIVVDGTGNGNESEYYLRGSGHWARIDATSWIDDVKQRLPPGMELWKGLWPDLTSMKVDTMMYRRGDANCCPTGGHVQISLGLSANRFVIESLAIGPPDQAP